MVAPRKKVEMSGEDIANLRVFYRPVCFVIGLSWSRAGRNRLLIPGMVRE